MSETQDLDPSTQDRAVALAPSTRVSVESFPHATLLMDARMTQCKYPIWKEGEKIEAKYVCGDTARLGKSWCEAHYGVVFDLTRVPRRLGA